MLCTCTYDVVILYGAGIWYRQVVYVQVTPFSLLLSQPFHVPQPCLEPGLSSSLTRLNECKPKNKKLICFCKLDILQIFFINLTWCNTMFLAGLHVRDIGNRGCVNRSCLPCIQGRCCHHLEWSLRVIGDVLSQSHCIPGNNICHSNLLCSAFPHFLLQTL